MRPYSIVNISAFEDLVLLYFKLMENAYLVGLKAPSEKTNSS